MRVPALVATLVLAPACTALESYPDVADEVCDNRADDDLDGLVDCDDPACAGHCSESGLARCSNGRDDDGDGYLDWADARCWSLAHVELERCPLDEGGTVEVPPAPGAWGFDAAAPVTVSTDPADPSRTVLGIEGTSAVAELVATRTSEGGWQGATFELEYWREGTSNLAFEADGPRGEVWARITASASTITASLPTATGFAEQSLDGPTTGWTRVTITFDAGAAGTSAHVAVTAGSTERAVDVHTPIAYPAAAQILPWAHLVVGDGTGASGRVLIGDTVVTQPTGGGCADTPTFVADFPGSVVHGATAAPSAVCLTSSMWAWRSGPELRGPLTERDLSLPSGLSLTDLVAIWDDERATFRAVGSSFSSPDTLDVAVLDSPDCVAWTSLGAIREGPTELPGTSSPTYPFGFSYGIRRASRSYEREHQLWLPFFGTETGEPLVGFVELASPTGEPGTFVQARSFLVGPEDGHRVNASDGVSVATIGNDHVFFMARDEGAVPGSFSPFVHAYLESEAEDGTWTEIDALRLGPPDIERANNFGPNRAILVELPGQTSARFDALLYVEEGGGEVARLTIGPPG